MISVLLGLILATAGAQEGEREKSAPGLRLSLLFDTSASAEGLDEVMHAVGVSLVEGLGLEHDDLAQVVTVGGRPDIVVPYTSDSRRLIEAILDVRAERSATALYNALFIAFKYAQQDDGDARRHAFVIVTDGRDTSSVVTREQLEAVSRQTGARLYAVIVGADMRRDRGDVSYLTSLAENHGGKAFIPSSVDELKQACAILLDELESYRAAERER